MSFQQTARAFALEKAMELANKARSIGIMRSVDATESAKWLKEDRATLTASGSSEAYTPPFILEAAREALGGSIDLDPFSCATANQEVRALDHAYTVDTQ